VKLHSRECGAYNGMYRWSFLSAFSYLEMRYTMPPRSSIEVSRGHETVPFH